VLVKGGVVWLRAVMSCDVKAGAGSGELKKGGRKEEGLMTTMRGRNKGKKNSRIRDPGGSTNGVQYGF